jgi:hypothetical protein
METHTIYCSACDRNVAVAFPSTPHPPGSAGAEVDPSGICMDYCSEQCTGTACALFDLPSSQMGERLKRTLAERGEI